MTQRFPDSLSLRLFPILLLCLLPLQFVWADGVKFNKGEKYELRIHTITLQYDSTETRPILQKSCSRELYEFEVKAAHRRKGYLLEMRHRRSSDYSFRKMPDDPLWYEELFWDSDIETPDKPAPMWGNLEETPFLLPLSADFHIPDSLQEKDWYTSELQEAFTSARLAADHLSATTVTHDYPEGIRFMGDMNTPHYHVTLERQQETRFTRIDTTSFAVAYGEDEIQTAVWPRTNTRVRGIVRKPGNLRQLTIKSSVNLPEVRQRLYQVPLNDGQFEFRINLEEPLSYVVLAGIYNLYLEPGDDLTVLIDTLNEELLPEFSGIGAGNNRYYAADGSHWGYALYYIREGSMCSRDYFKALDQKAGDYRKKMEQQKAGFSLDFYQYMTDELKYRPVYHKLIHDKDTTVGLFDCLAGVEICNPLALASDSYLSVLRHCMRFMIPKRIASITQAWINYQSPYEQAVAMLDGKVLNAFLVEMIAERLKGNFEEGKAWYERYKREYVKSPYTGELDRIFAEAGRLAPGNPAPDFTLRDTAGREVSLSDFRGKVVYIDFWGTGCGPCMYEFKNTTPALEKHFEGKDVVFINISSDRQEKTWKKTLAQFNIQGINLLDTRGGKANKLYRVSGIPHYVLIGRDGRIIDAHAPRPSMNARKAIEAALE